MTKDNEHIKIFHEIIKIGSKTVDNSNILEVSKNSAALSVLNSAMAMVSLDPVKADRLKTLARNIVD